jgi:hypothetical protein
MPSLYQSKSVNTLWRQLSRQASKTTLGWPSTLIIKTWDVAWDQWEHRNGILHGNLTIVTVKEIERIEATIRNEFDTGR